VTLSVTLDCAGGPPDWAGREHPSVSGLSLPHASPHPPAMPQLPAPTFGCLRHLKAGVPDEGKNDSIVIRPHTNSNDLGVTWALLGA
jgi:hypothetical protein